MSQAPSMTLRHRLAKQLACDASAVGSWALLECVSPMKRPLYRLARWIQPSAVQRQLFFRLGDN